MANPTKKLIKKKTAKKLKDPQDKYKENYNLTHLKETDDS